MNSEQPAANSGPPVQRFADAETVSRELASRIAAALGAALAARGLASLVVSGGRSPTRMFEILRTQPLPAPYEHMIVDIWGQSREQWRARAR